MSDDLRRLAQELQRRCTALEQRIKALPSRFPRGGGGTPLVWLRILGGNELRATPQVVGIKRVATLPASLADGIDLDDPATLDSLPDGIGVAEISSGGRVMVAYPESRGPLAALIAGWRYPIGPTATIPATTISEPDYTVYLVP